MPRWLILVHRIPPRPLYLRAKMRQRLAAAGAIAVKNSVYLLPHGAESLEDLQWIAQEIVAGGGDAHLFAGDFVDGVANDAAVAQFRRERDADYAALVEEAKGATKSASAAELQHLTRRMEEIREIDFFDAPGRAAADTALAAIEKRLEKEKKEEKKMPQTHPELRGKTWVTRPGVKVDRMASAWLIRRFVDPKARFRFADPAAPRKEGELRFDMVGGDFTHEENRCTFETLIRRTGLADKRVRAIAEMVHDLDLKDSKYGRAETAGLRMILDGIMARTSDDDERIDRAFSVFDDIYDALSRRQK
jgi:hypothetical protein